MDGTACVSVGGGGLRVGGGEGEGIWLLIAWRYVYAYISYVQCHFCIWATTNIVPLLKLEYELETCVCTTPVLILST